MKKILGGILGIGLLGTILLFGLGSRVESEIDKGADSITISTIQKMQPPVVFPHKNHQDMLSGKCVECHHTTKEGEQTVSCASCHNKEGAKVVLKDAYHKKCKDCHQKEATAGKKAPTKCNECHKKS